MAERLYRQIFTQIQGLQWKDGGPVMAAQFDNEYRGKGICTQLMKNMIEYAIKSQRAIIDRFRLKSLTHPYLLSLEH